MGGDIPDNGDNDGRNLPESGGDLCGNDVDVIALLLKLRIPSTGMLLSS